MKKSAILFILLIVISIFSLVLVKAEVNGKDLNYYIENPSEFVELSAEDKNKLIEEDNNPVHREAMIRKVIEGIERNKLSSVSSITDSLKKNEFTEDIQKQILNTWGKRFFDEFNKNSKDLKISFDTVKKFLKDMKGIDLDAEKIELELVKGFESNDLKWKDKKVVGNGKVWLDLEKIPYGVSEIEYKDGKFHLRFKDKGSVVLGEGATNEKGEFVFNTKGLVNFDLKDISCIQGEGVLELTKDGFKINSPGKFSIGEYAFSRTIIQDKDEESIVKVLSDRFIVKGTEFTKLGYVTLKSSNQETIVSIGDMKGLIKQISFGDYQMKFKSSLGFPAPSPPSWKVESTGKVWFYFDETGKLTHIAKEGVNNKDWLSINGELEGDLKSIYDLSSKTVQGIIKRASNGERVDYGYIYDRFYGNEEKGIKADSQLKADAREINIEYYHNNFLNINGENLGVGGKGGIEVLKNLNSIVGYNKESSKLDFSIDVGDFYLKFEGDKILGSRQNADNVLNIGEISLQKQDGTYTNSYVIKKLENGVYATEDSGTFFAGRKTNLISTSMGQVSTDVSVEISADKLDEIKKQTEGVWNRGNQREEFITAMKKSDFKLNLDVFAPDIGVSVSGDLVRSATKEIILTQLRNVLLGNNGKNGLEFTYIDKNNYRISDKTEKTFESIANNILENAKNIQGGKFSISITNGPNPQIQVGFPGQEISPPISLSGNEASLIRDVMEASLRAPQSEKGEFDFNYFGARKSNYWSNDYLRRLWNNNFGKGQNQWDRQLFKPDQDFFHTTIPKNYLEPVK